MMSLLFGFGGIVSEQTHTQDWWQPLTLTGTRIGVEDFLIGFAIGGIAAVIYAEAYRKKVSRIHRGDPPAFSFVFRGAFCWILLLYPAGIFLLC